MNNNIDYKQISNFLKTPRGRAALFFGIYIIFFAILAILVRTGDFYNEDNKHKKKKKLPFSINKIEKGNYHFKYMYELDNKKDVFEGDRYKDRELFTYNSTKYYKDEDNFLVYKSNLWVKSDNPYILKEFIDTNNIYNIGLKASYISKTEYESGMRVYSYKISTTTLIKLLDKQDIDLDDPVNEIIFKTDENNEVNNIKYDLSSYCKYKKTSKKNCKLELEYTNFGKIKEIEEVK